MESCPYSKICVGYREEKYPCESREIIDRYSLCAMFRFFDLHKIKSETEMNYQTALSESIASPSK